MCANLLSMGAVDFGVIVDGGVVIIEAILARLAHDARPGAAGGRASGRRPEPWCGRRCSRCSIIIAAYLPIFLLERVEGRIFAPMANTVVAALSGALVFSVTLVPVLAAFAYRGPVPPPGVARAARGGTGLRRHAALLPRSPLAWCSALVGAAARRGGLDPAAPGQRVPPRAERGRALRHLHPPLEHLARPRAASWFRASRSSSARQPEVESVLSQLGRPEDGTDATLTNNLEFFVQLKPPEQWPPGIDDARRRHRRPAGAIGCESRASR